jgi:hypothetical protein
MSANLNETVVAHVHPDGEWSVDRKDRHPPLHPKPPMAEFPVLHSPDANTTEEAEWIRIGDELALLAGIPTTRARLISQVAMILGRSHIERFRTMDPGLIAERICLPAEAVP